MKKLNTIERQKREQLENRIFILILIAAIVILVATAIDFEANSSTKPDTGLWLARSCVGEAGWKAHETGECAAIMHVYKKRSEMGSRSLYKIIRKYSAATKTGPHQRNRWLFHMGRCGERPQKWPSNADWKKYLDNWNSTLKLADDFLLGEVKDPLPSAVHYGGRFEEWRALNAGWWKIKAPFRNLFYSVQRPPRS